MSHDLAAVDKRGTKLYFPADMLAEIHEAAERLERPVSVILALAWKLARERVAQFPGVR